VSYVTGDLQTEEKEGKESPGHLSWTRKKKERGCTGIERAEGGKVAYGRRETGRSREDGIKENTSGTFTFPNEDEGILYTETWWGIRGRREDRKRKLRKATVTVRGEFIY